MKTVKTSLELTRQLATITATTAIAVAPLVGNLTSAHAKPPKHAPAYGYKKDKKHRGYYPDYGRNDDRGYNNGDYDQDYNDNGGNDRDTDSIGRSQRIQGVVSRDLIGDSFALRLSNGRSVVVDTQGKEPGRLSIGDRVEVRGYYGRDAFIADRVTIVSEAAGDTYNDSSNAKRIVGVVSRDIEGDSFALRLSNGRSVLVDTRGAEPGRLSKGDRVEVRGYYGRDSFVANDVRILNDVRDGHGYNNNDRSQRADFTGTVATIVSSSRFTMRGENGRTYLIASDSRLSTKINIGDTVRVIGYTKGGEIVADQVQLVRDNSRGRRYIELDAIVISLDSARRLTVRSADKEANTFRVVSATDLDRAISRGDKIKIIGTSNGDSIVADRIAMRSDGNGRGSIFDRNRDRNGDGLPDRDVVRGTKKVSFSAVVESVEEAFNTMRVRAENGQRYVVRYRRAGEFRRGDRVRVAGVYDGKVISATGVQAL